MPPPITSTRVSSATSVISSGVRLGGGANSLIDTGVGGASPRARVGSKPDGPPLYRLLGPYWLLAP